MRFWKFMCRIFGHSWHQVIGSGGEWREDAEGNNLGYFTTYRCVRCEKEIEDASYKHGSARRNWWGG